MLFKRKPRILMVPTMNAGCVFYRMEQFVVEMRKMGYEVAYSYHPHDYTGPCMWEQNLDQRTIDVFDKLMTIADIAIFQSIHTPQATALIKGLKDVFGKPVLGEYDDDVFAINSECLSYKLTQPGGDAEWFNKNHIMNSDGLIVSTDYLKDKYGSLNKRIYTIPNAINFDVWDKVKKGGEHKRIRIGWVGGASHSGDLRLVKDAIYRILDRHKNVEIYFHMGGLPQKWMLGRPRFHAFHKWFTIDKYHQGFAKYNFDIGIAPLRDTEFNRAKSNLRFLEFAALGIPIVASNVEPYKETIKHGKTGLLATEPEEWYKYLDYLVRNETERKKMGERAYRYVKKKYNIHRMTVKYLKVLKRFL